MLSLFLVPVYVSSSLLIGMVGFVSSLGQISHATLISGLRLLGVKHLSDQQSFQLMQKHREPDNFSGLMTRSEFEACIRSLMNGMSLPSSIRSPYDNTTYPIFTSFFFFFFFSFFLCFFSCFFLSLLQWLRTSPVRIKR